MAGTLTIGTLSDGTSSASARDAIKGSARAWVNFAGSTAGIRASYNVSSVTRNSTGDYTINFANAMPDASYAAAFAGQYDTTSPANIGVGFVGISRSASAKTASALRINTASFSTAPAFWFLDYPDINVAIFR